MGTLFIIFVLICIYCTERNARVPAKFTMGEEKNIDAGLIGSICLINALQWTVPILEHQVPAIWDDGAISGKNDCDLLCSGHIVAPWIGAPLEVDDSAQLCRGLRVLVCLMPQ